LTYSSAPRSRMLCELVSVSRMNAHLQYCLMQTSIMLLKQDIGVISLLLEYRSNVLLLMLYLHFIDALMLFIIKQ